MPPLHRFLAPALALFVGVLGTPAQAGVGLTEWPGENGDGPVTLFYPSTDPDQPVRRGPFELAAAWQGAPGAGNGRLVVISHGSGGNPWVSSDLARTLVAAGFVVAVPQHRGDHTGDFSAPGPASWQRRPAEVSRAIDAVAHHPAWAQHLQLDRVGVYGGSAGGHTALTLAGGQWSAARFLAHCEAHLSEDFSSCVGFTTRLRGHWLDGPKQWVARLILRLRFNDATVHAHTDPRIAAAVAEVPFAADFDPESLRHPTVPVGLVGAGQDINQVPRFHVDAVAAACATCTWIARLPQAGHGMMLSPLPPLDEGSIAQALLADPPGFDRASLPAVHQRITAFFERHLLGNTLP